jgi:hypothetical protein
MVSGSRHDRREGKRSMSSSPDRRRQDAFDLAIIEFSGGLRVDPNWLVVFVLLLSILGEEPSE